MRFPPVFAILLTIFLSSHAYSQRLQENQLSAPPSFWAHNVQITDDAGNEYNDASGWVRLLVGDASGQVVVLEEFHRGIFTGGHLNVPLPHVDVVSDAWLEIAPGGIGDFAPAILTFQIHPTRAVPSGVKEVWIEPLMPNQREYVPWIPLHRLSRPQAWRNANLAAIPIDVSLQNPIPQYAQYGWLNVFGPNAMAGAGFRAGYINYQTAMAFSDNVADRYGLGGIVFTTTQPTDRFQISVSGPPDSLHTWNPSSITPNWIRILNWDDPLDYYVDEPLDPAADVHSYFIETVEPVQECLVLLMYEGSLETMTSSREESECLDKNDDDPNDESPCLCNEEVICKNILRVDADNCESPDPDGNYPEPPEDGPPPDTYWVADRLLLTYGTFSSSVQALGWGITLGVGKHEGDHFAISYRRNSSDVAESYADVVTEETRMRRRELGQGWASVTTFEVRQCKYSCTVCRHNADGDSEVDDGCFVNCETEVHPSVKTVTEKVMPPHAIVPQNNGRSEKRRCSSFNGLERGPGDSFIQPVECDS